MELLQLLPDSEHIQIQNYEVDRVQKQVQIDLCSTQASAPCPICQHEAVRVHSRYERTLGVERQLRRTNDNYIGRHRIKV